MGTHHWALSANDRFELSLQMADVMQLERLIEFPVTVLFWRSPDRPVVHRRHPLLSAEIGTCIDQFSVDVLHTLRLGTFQDWILRALWLFVDFDLLDTWRKAKSQILTETLSRIRRMLSAWYPIYEKKLRDNKATHVGSVFNNLTGSDGERVLRLKASRARGRIGFARCWRRAAVVHGCAEARATEIVEGWAPHARGLLRHPQLPSIACWNQNETKTSLALGDNDAEWKQRESPTLFDLL